MSAWRMFRPTGALTLAANHITAMDPIIIGVGCKLKFHFIAKEELFEKDIVGWFLANLNAFPVDRSKFDFPGDEPCRQGC